MWSQLWSSYIGSRSSKELHTSCVCSCITSTLDKHHNTCQTVYPQFLHSAADTSSGRLAQWITFGQEQELDLENEVSPTVAQPPGTLFLPTSTTLLTPVHSENDSTVYFLIMLTADYCWRSWTCRIAAPYKFCVDWLIPESQKLNPKLPAGRQINRMKRRVKQVKVKLYLKQPRSDVENRRHECWWRGRGQVVLWHALIAPDLTTDKHTSLCAQTS